MLSALSWSTNNSEQHSIIEVKKKLELFIVRSVYTDSFI